MSLKLADKPLLYQNQALNNSLGEGRSLDLDTSSNLSQCQYKGKFYNIGEDVIEASDSGSCRAACMCSGNSQGKAKISCASIECPENLGMERVNCIPLYKRKSCCAYDFYCPNGTYFHIMT